MNFLQILFDYFVGNVNNLGAAEVCAAVPLSSFQNGRGVKSPIERASGTPVSIRETGVLLGR
jgi:hypothetical protein